MGVVTAGATFIGFKIMSCRKTINLLSCPQQLKSIKGLKVMCYNSIMWFKNVVVWYFCTFGSCLQKEICHFRNKKQQTLLPRIMQYQGWNFSPDQRIPLFLLLYSVQKYRISWSFPWFSFLFLHIGNWPISSLNIYLIIWTNLNPKTAQH